MRLNRIRLSPYGALSDTTLELGDGLTVVHGVNEAGKTTLLSAYADLLCGIPRNTTMDFVFGRPKLRIQAAVTLNDESSTEVIRTSKNSPNDLLNSTTGQPAAQDIRQALAEGFDQKNLLTRFGLDHDRLVRGGRDLMEGAGTLADIVFEARSGTDVRVLVDNLESDLAALFGPKTTSAALINRANSAREDLAKSLKNTMATAEAVEAAANRRKQAETDLEQSRLRQARQQSERDRLALLLGSWSYWEQYRVLRDQLQQIDENGSRLSPERLRIVQAAVNRLDGIHNEINDENTAAENARRERSQLAVNETLLAAQPAIDTLEAEQPEASAASTHAAQLLGQVATKSEELAKCLGRLGLNEISDPISAVARIAVSDDRLADLNSLVEKNEQLQKDLHKEQHAVREAAEQLEGALQTAKTGSSESVVSTRGHRDALWKHVRLNWLEDVEIPAEVASGPVDLAEGYMTAVGESDSAAEGLAVEAANAATIEERRRALKRREQALSQVRQALADWQIAWTATTSAAGLPPGLGVPGWYERSELLAEAAQLAQSIGSIERQRSNDLDVATEWNTAGVALATSLGQTVAAEHVEAWFDQTKAAYDESKANRRAAEVHLKREKDAEARVAHLGEERLGLEDLLDTASAEHSVDRSGLSALIDRSEAYTEVLTALTGPEGQLRARHPESTLVELKEQFATRDRDELGVDLDSATDSLEVAVGAAQQAQDDAFSARKALEELTGRTGADSLQQELSDAKAHVLELIEDYATTRIMHHLLTQELRAYLESHKNPVLEMAGLYLGRLTQGRYVALRADGDGTNRSLIVIGSDGADYETKDLSEGTSSQLYLALNLAGVLEVEHERHESGQEKLPIMLDDVLMAFDDDRAECALDLLAEIGAHQQIVLFTHHEAVREKAASLGGTVRIVNLDPPAPMD